MYKKKHTQSLSSPLSMPTFCYFPSSPYTLQPKYTLPNSPFIKHHYITFIAHQTHSPLACKSTVMGIMPVIIVMVPHMDRSAISASSQWGYASLTDAVMGPHVFHTAHWKTKKNSSVITIRQLRNTYLHNLFHVMYNSYIVFYFTGCWD